ncbi:substrate-binding domain-containing protein [Piscinibacter sakaiensis]|uniref:Transcriptional regulator AglR, LacI family n=1 Tax=Piscinibacter sakaiensis TaxID=1547922 RepID=A0A0K8P5Z6_PISS1|nr:substrate-binding domain-containing protein [Piscinibacter sakaiensis]GAP37949.1 transcriptional regulator AglR, LacI family [Piscinibacter sakaiensis]
MPVNLKDLSAHLGLSPTTVSRALSGYSDVSPATRERVRQAAQELGYQPNRAARQVALGRADAVGIVYSPATEFLGNPSFLQMLEGLARTLDEAGCDLLLAAAPTEDELPIYDRMVRGRRVDALVVAHTLREDPRIRYLQDSGFPFVAYGRTARADGFPWFDFDNEACSRLAVQALVAAGHRMIAYVHAPLHYNFAFQRHAGFLAAMRKARLPVDPACVLAGSLERRAGYAAARQLLAMPAAQRPTAVVVDNNIGGIGMIRALLDAGLRLGHDMSLVVNEGIPEDTLFGGIEVAAVTQPTAFESGRSIGRMVRALVERQPLDEPHQLRQPAYVPGNSVGPPAPR